MLPYDRDQDMPDPDWGRVLVNTAQKKMPSGDPTLWGNTVTTLIDGAPDAADVGPRAIYGAQIILAQATDRYSRPWSLSGTLTAPTGAWEGLAPAAPPDGPFFGDGLDRPDLAVYLSIVQGVEKTTIEHLICLMYGPTTTNIGLCNNQCTLNGGPYLPMPADISGVAAQTRPFAAIGSLIGNTITVRGLYIRSFRGEIDIPSATLSVVLAPSAAGAGI